MIWSVIISHHVLWSHVTVDAGRGSVCSFGEDHVCVQPSRAVQAVDGGTWTANVSVGVNDTGCVVV